MSDQSEEKDTSERPKPTLNLPGKLEKLIPSFAPGEPEKIQIALEGADDLYSEIRVENKLQDADGNVVSVKKGADVDVTIEANHSEIQERETSE